MSYPAKYEQLYDEANQAVTRTVRSVLATSSSIVNIGVEIEDCTQDIWLQCWLALEEGKSITVNWMTRVAKRAASNYRRSSQFKQGLFAMSLDEPIVNSAGEETAFLDTYSPPDDSPYPDTRPGRLMEALKGLPVAYTEIIFLHHLEMKSVEDLATHYGITKAAARKRLQRATAAVIDTVGHDSFHDILAA